MIAFIPYVAACLILAAVAYGIFVIFRAGKLSEISSEQTKIIEIKNEQENIEARRPANAGDLLKRMSDEANKR